MLVLDTDKLTKIYPTGGGCFDISLQVASGETFGLLGPNGAGKSTFIKMLVGLLFPTSGKASILGRPLGDLEVRRRIGFLPENFRYHDWLSARELLEFHGRLDGMDYRQVKQHIPEVLDLVKLNDAENKSVRQFSKGMQQRLGLAIAMLPGPRLLFLDEPTSALDPVGRIEIREIIQHLQQQDVTVFLNSHLLTEVERVCGRIAMIRSGRVVITGSLDELLGGSLEVELEIGGLNADLLTDLQKYGAVGSREPVAGVAGVERLRVQISGRDQVPLLASRLVNGGARIYHLSMVRNSLEELFVELMSGEAGEDHV
jgi:ABC-2 type transport system ATP-binding protein